MKILVYDSKIRKHMFLNGSKNKKTLHWTGNIEDAGNYTQDEFNQVTDDYKNGLLSSNFAELAYIKC